MVRAVETIMVQCGSDEGSPHAGARIVSQLQACLTHEDKISGVLLWMVGTPEAFPQATIPNSSLTNYFLPMRALLQTIQQPVLGVALGCVDPLATKLLQACDYVMADNSTVLSTDGHGHILADEALRVGLVQMVVQKKDFRARCDIMTRMLEIHTPDDLARLKLKFQSDKLKASSVQGEEASIQQPAYVRLGFRPPEHDPPPCPVQSVPSALPTFIKVKDKGHRTTSTLFSSSLLPDIDEPEGSDYAASYELEEDD
jgi:hypothetical protein